MEQARVYEAAREVLKEIKDEPVSRLTIGEALFLFRQCMHTPEFGLNVVSTFTEQDLRELFTIAGAIAKRGGPRAIH